MLSLHLLLGLKRLLLRSLECLGSEHVLLLHLWRQIGTNVLETRLERVLTTRKKSEADGAVLATVLVVVAYRIDGIISRVSMKPERDRER